MSFGRKDTHSTNLSSLSHSLEQFDRIANKSGINEQHKDRQRKYNQQNTLLFVFLALIIFMSICFIVIDQKQDLRLRRQDSEIKSALKSIKKNSEMLNNMKWENSKRHPSNKNRNRDTIDDAPILSNKTEKFKKSQTLVRENELNEYVGHWALNTNGALILCHKETNKSSELTCNGIKVIVNDTTITLINHGREKGIYDGNNTIDWGNYKWVRRDECALGQWEEWSSCSSTCAGGFKSRSKTILIEPSNEKSECKMENETLSCNEVIGCPVDCVLGQWEVWSSCSATCGGLRKRKREIWIQPTNEGSECSHLTETLWCNGTGKVCLGDVVTASCRGTYDANAKYINSPNYPLSYGRSESCTWKLEVPHGMRLKLKRFDYKLERHEVACSEYDEFVYDVLYIYDGANAESTEIARVCDVRGTQADILSSSNSLFLRFRTDSSFQRQGFKIFYEFE